MVYWAPFTTTIGTSINATTTCSKCSPCISIYLYMYASNKYHQVNVIIPREKKILRYYITDYPISLSVPVLVYLCMYASNKYSNTASRRRSAVRYSSAATFTAPGAPSKALFVANTITCGPRTYKHACKYMNTRVDRLMQSSLAKPPEHQHRAAPHNEAVYSGDTPCAQAEAPLYC